MFYCAIYRDRRYWEEKRLVDITHTYQSVEKLHKANEWRKDLLIEVLSAEDKMQFNHLIKAAIKKARDWNDLTKKPNSSAEGDTSAST